MHGLKAQLTRPSKRRRIDEFAADKKKKKKKKEKEEAVDVSAKLAAKARVYDELASGAKTADASEVLVDFGSVAKEPLEARDADTAWAWSTGHRRASSATAEIKAMVQSQWDKTLSDQQKGYLDDIAEETTRGRARAQDKAMDRAQRRLELASRLDPQDARS